MDFNPLHQEQHSALRIRGRTSEGRNARQYRIVHYYWSRIDEMSPSRLRARDMKQALRFPVRASLRLCKHCTATKNQR